MNTKRQKRWNGFVFCLFLFGLGSIVQGVDWFNPNFSTVPIPNYFGTSGEPGGLAGGYPKMDGWNTIWTGPGVGHPEIFLFDGNQTTQISSTPNPLGNFDAHIFQNKVAYIGDDGTYFQVYQYDLNTQNTTTYTTNSNPYKWKIDDTHNPYVVVEEMDQWLGSPWVPTFINMYLCDGTNMVLLNPRTFNHSGQVSSNRVVWQSSNSLGGPYDIYLYDILPKTIMPLTNMPPWSFHDPQLSDPHIAWWGSNGAQSDITYYQLGIIPTKMQIAVSNTYQWPRLAISGSHVFWAWTDDTDGYGIYHYHYNPPFPLTEKLLGEPTHLGRLDSMDTCNSHLAFCMHYPGSEDYEIYVWDIANRSLKKVATGKSQGPVYVQVSSILRVPYGYLPVVVWEENLGGPTQAYFATQLLCSPAPPCDTDRRYSCGPGARTFGVRPRPRAIRIGIVLSTQPISAICHHVGVKPTAPI